jgi:hypothetical protein
MDSRELLKNKNIIKLFNIEEVAFSDNDDID